MSFVISNKSQVAIQIHHNFESSHSCGLDVLFPSNKMIYDQNFLSQLKLKDWNSSAKPFNSKRF